MTVKNKEQLRTKSDIIKEFAEDELELNYHADYEAEQMGISVKQFAKNIAETQFDIMISEGSIIKVGRKYLVK
jgi:hypothetical protein